MARAKAILSAKAERSLLDLGIKGALVVGVFGVGGWAAYTYTDIGRAANARVTIGPQAVSPNSFVTLQGTFLDHNNKPTMVFQGHYKVYDTKTSKVLQEGSLGNFITDFSVQVPTTNMTDGQYAIGISDRNVIDDLLGAPAAASNITPTMATTPVVPSGAAAEQDILASSGAGYFYPVKI